MVSRPKTRWDKDRDHCLHGRSTHSTATGYVFFSVRCISQSSAAAYLQRPAVCLPLVRTWIGVDTPQKNQFLVGYYIDVYYIYIVCYVCIYIYVPVYIYILSPPFYGKGTYPKCKLHFLRYFWRGPWKCKLRLLKVFWRPSPQKRHLEDVQRGYSTTPYNEMACRLQLSRVRMFA